MAIKIYSDRIELGDKVITATPLGIRIGDSLLANTQNNRFGFTNFTARQILSANSPAVALVESTFQGTVSGYTMGGDGPLNTIDKFSFATSANATDVGDLAYPVSRNAGQSSPTNGYSTGSVPTSPSPLAYNSIQKFPFTSDTNATDIGDLTLTMWAPCGQSSSTSGYSSATYTGGYLNNINKFPFTSDTNATDIGDLTIGRYSASGQSSVAYGYVSGGQAPAGPSGTAIDKFTFAADNNATRVGDLKLFSFHVAGQSSSISGYTTTYTTPRIEKFPFATDTNSTIVGNMVESRSYVAGQSAVFTGYISGGNPPAPGGTNRIERFSFATDANATDHADLTQARLANAGAQY